METEEEVVEAEAEDETAEEEAVEALEEAVEAPGVALGALVVEAFCQEVVAKVVQRPLHHQWSKRLALLERLPRPHVNVQGWQS